MRFCTDSTPAAREGCLHRVVIRKLEIKDRIIRKQFLIAQRAMKVRVNTVRYLYCIFKGAIPGSEERLWMLSTVLSRCDICKWGFPISQSEGDLHKLGSTARQSVRPISGRAPTHTTSHSSYNTYGYRGLSADGPPQQWSWLWLLEAGRRGNICQRPQFQWPLRTPALKVLCVSIKNCESKHSEVLKSALMKTLHPRHPH